MTYHEWNAAGRGTTPDRTPVVIGLARCPHVHEWPVDTFMQRSEVQAEYGSYMDTRRVVEPANCPQCGERYDEIVADYFDPPGGKR